MRFESRRGQNEEKWEKNAFLKFGKRFFFTVLFWLVLSLRNSKVICKA